MNNILREIMNIRSTLLSNLMWPSMQPQKKQVAIVINQTDKKLQLDMKIN
jgi:hypothetical protein